MSDPKGQTLSSTVGDGGTGHSKGMAAPPPAPIGLFAQCAAAGRILAVSGQLPKRDGRLTATGRVGEAVSVPQAEEAGRTCARNALTAVALAAEGGLDSLALLRVTVLVACAPDVEVPIPRIADAASETLAEELDGPLPARTAFGVIRLPANAPVEVELTFVERHSA